jgi:electron transfer flavoprotein alpha subunit
MAALVLAQHDNARLDTATLHAVTAARQLAPELDLLVAGQGCAAVAAAAARIPGVRRVLHVEAAAYAQPVAEELAALLLSVADAYDHLVAASTTTGKNVMPRLAALLDSAQVSDIVAVVGPDTFQRYVYAGNALATVKSSDAKRVLTVRPTAFAAAPAEGGSAEVVTVAAVEPSGLVAFLGREVSRSDRPDLGSAKIVVSGGRGPTRSGRRWAPAGRRWTRATRPTTGRSGRPARSWRPSCTWRWGSAARSSTWRG